VVDLAAGSGLTALAALAQVDAGLRLILVDKSPSMIAEARRHLGDRAAAYHVADAAGLAEVITEPVDRVLCNLSFYEFRDPEAVLGQIRRILKPTGRLCFTLSGTYFNTGGGVVSPQWALMRVLYEQGHISRPLPEVERLPNQRSIEGTLHSAGFKPFRYQVDEFESAVPDSEPGGELYNLLRLCPVTPDQDFHAAVRQSHALLAGAATDLARFRPRWRTVLFVAQPAISPEEALRRRMGPRP
jgi:SAM-dependent methyltransferase